METGTTSVAHVELNHLEFIITETFGTTIRIYGILIALDRWRKMKCSCGTRK
jgi:hypothetical protein